MKGIYYLYVNGIKIEVQPDLLVLANVPDKDKSEMLLPTNRSVNYFTTLKFTFSLRDKYNNAYAGYEYKLLKDLPVVPVQIQINSKEIREMGVKIDKTEKTNYQQSQRKVFIKFEPSSIDMAI